MNRVTATILTLAIAASGAFGADPPEKKEVPLPAPVVAAENALNVAVSKAYSAYLKSVEAEVKKAQDALERQKVAATKAGNLELAMAIKGKQDALTVDAVVAKAAESGSDLLGEGKKVDSRGMWVGKWRFVINNKPEAFLIVDDKFNVTHSDGVIGSLNSENENFTIIWNNGTRWTLQNNGTEYTANGKIILYKK